MLFSERRGRPGRRTRLTAGSDGLVRVFVREPTPSGSGDDHRRAAVERVLSGCRRRHRVQGRGRPLVDGQEPALSGETRLEAGDLRAAVSVLRQVRDISRSLGNRAGMGRALELPRHAQE